MTRNDIRDLQSEINSVAIDSANCTPGWTAPIF
jgi:hypothetical protein